MNDNRKLIKLLNKRNDTKQDIVRSNKKIISINEDRKKLVEEITLDEKNRNRSIQFDRKIQGNGRQLTKERATLLSYQDASEILEKSILEEAEKIKGNAVDELWETATEAEQKYQEKRQETIELRIKIMQCEKEENIKHMQARRARGETHSFDKHFDAKKVSMVIENPKLWLSQLNENIAEAIGILDEYLEAKSEHEKQCEKERQQIKQAEQRRIEHRKELLKRAEKAIATGNGIPDVYRSSFMNRTLTPFMLLNYLLKLENEGSMKAGDLK